MTDSPTPPDPAKVRLAANIQFGGFLISAAMIAFIGTLMPTWLEVTGIEGTILQLVLYAVALSDAVAGFWVRKRFLKANAAPNSGDAIQRQ